MREKPVILRKLSVLSSDEKEKPWGDRRYYEVRNQAWRCLLENKVSSLPVDVKKLLDKHCILQTFTQAKPVFEGILEEGIFTSCECFTIFYKGKNIVIYNDELEITDLNYALAHELGHIYLSHYQNQDQAYEKEAEAFAARVTAPLCVLRACKVADKEEVSCLCEIPLRIAENRFERMKAIQERDKYLTSELERKVLANFEEFINGYVDYYHKHD